MTYQFTARPLTLFSHTEVLPNVIASCNCKCHFQGQKYDLCDIWTNNLETVHAITNVSMKDIYKVIYDLSVYIMTFDLGLPLKVT